MNWNKRSPRFSLVLRELKPSDLPITHTPETKQNYVQM